MKRKIYISLILVFLVNFLTLFYEVLKKESSDFLWSPIIDFTILTVILILLFDAWKQIGNFFSSTEIKFYIRILPVFIYLIGILNLFYQPLNFNIDEIVYGKIIFRACYEGTQTTKVLFLRSNNDFDIEYTGFFSHNYLSGTYKIDNDTLLLNFDKGNQGFSSKFIMNDKNRILKPLPQNNRKQYFDFYYGYCKRLN